MDEINTETREKQVADKVDGLARQLAKNWTIVKNADSAWDFRSFDKALTAYASGVEELTRCWSGYEQDLVADMEQSSKYVESDEYRQELEEALTAAGIPLQGTFPQYEFVPFKLTVAITDNSYFAVY